MGKCTLYGARGRVPLLALLVLPACGSWDPGQHENPSTEAVASSVTQRLDPTFVAAAGGARRVLARHYERAIADMLGPAAAAAAHASAPKDPNTGGVDAIAARELPIDPLSVQQLEASAFAVADAALANPTKLAEQAPCVTQGRFDQPSRVFCYGQVAQRIANLAWRIPPTQELKNRLIQLGQLGEQGAILDQDKLKSGLRVLLATILESPSFLYSIEVGNSVAGTTNRTLNSFELATRMSLFLTGRLPSESYSCVPVQASSPMKLASELPRRIYY